MKLKVRNPSSTEIEEINYGMWQKNGNVLELDAANNDYVELSGNDIGAWTTLDDVYFSIDVNLIGEGTNQTIFSRGAFANASSGIILLRRISDDRIRLQISDINNGVNETYSGTISTGRHSLILDKNLFYIDGALVFTFAASKSINIPSTNVIRLGALSYGGAPTQFLEGQYFNSVINSTDYPLIEGKGSITNGATISTSHADGITYINNSIWSNDSWTSGYYIDNEVWDESKQKWLPFKK